MDVRSVFGTDSWEEAVLRKIALATAGVPLDGLDEFPLIAEDLGLKNLQAPPIIRLWEAGFITSHGGEYVLLTEAGFNLIDTMVYGGRRAQQAEAAEEERSKAVRESMKVGEADMAQSAIWGTL